MTRSVAQKPQPNPDATLGAATASGGDHLILLHPIDTDDWLAELDGRVVIAHSATTTALGHDSPNRADAIAKLDTLTSLEAPQLVGVIASCDSADGSSWLVSETADGVSLRRVLSIATLTPTQAAFIAMRVVDGLITLHTAGFGHGRMHAGNVIVDTSGEPRMTHWALSTLAGTRPPDELAAADLSSARSLVAELARNANRPVVFTRQCEEAVLVCLEHCGNGGSAAGLAVMSTDLKRVLQACLADDTGMVATRAELGALVLAVTQRVATGKDGGRDGPVRAGNYPAGSDAARASWQHPLAVPPGTVPARLSQARWHHRTRHIWRGVLATALVLAVVAAIAFIVARKPISSLTDRILHRHAASSSTHSAAPPLSHRAGSAASGRTTHPANSAPRHGAPLPVTALAPFSAGPVSAVSLRPFATCTAGTACPMRVTVTFAPAYNGEPVRWHIAVTDRCTGVTTVIGRSTVSGAPGSYVFDSTSPRLPAAKSMAVSAVTDSPAHAGSAPMLVPSNGGRC